MTHEKPSLRAGLFCFSARVPPIRSPHDTASSTRHDARPEHFLNTQDWSRPELDALLAQAARSSAASSATQLKGKSIALVFFNPSLRTRTSFELGAFQLGGHAVVLQPGKDAWPIEFDLGTVMDGEAEEHIAEVAQVLSRYVDLIGVRAFPKFVDWALDREDRVLRGLREVLAGAGDQHGDDHPSVPGAGAHPGAAGALRHHRPARQEVRADLDLPPQAAQHRGRQLGADHRHAHGHGRDPAVPDARVRARRALHGLGRRRTSPRAAARCRSATTSRAPTPAPTWSTPRAGARCRTSATGRRKSPSATSTSTSSSTRPRWR